MNTLTEFDILAAALIGGMILSALLGIGAGRLVWSDWKCAFGAALVALAIAASIIFTTWGAYTISGLEPAALGLMLFGVVATLLATVMVSQATFTVRGIAFLVVAACLVIVQIGINTVSVATVLVRSTEALEAENLAQDTDAAWRENRQLALEDERNAKASLASATAEVRRVTTEKDRECASGVGPKCNQLVISLEAASLTETRAYDALVRAQDRVASFGVAAPSLAANALEAPERVQDRRSDAQEAIDLVFSERFWEDIRVSGAAIISAAVETSAALVLALVMPWFLQRSAKREVAVDIDAMRARDAEFADKLAAEADRAQRAEDQAAKFRPELEAAIADAEDGRRAAETAQAELARLTASVSDGEVQRTLLSLSEFNLQEALSEVDVDADRTEAAVLALRSGEKLDDEDLVRVRIVHDIVAA